MSPAVPAEPIGYPDRLSRRTGERVVFRLGGSLETGDALAVEGLGGEVVGEVSVGPGGADRPMPDAPWRDGFGLPTRASFQLEPSLPSGVYTLAGGIPFVNRGAGGARVAVLLPSNTGVAFNDAGGRSLYRSAGAPPADVLSFHRPLSLSLLLNGCEPFVRWFERANPYAEETTYLTDTDLELPGALDGVEVLLVIGRSEYWTRAMRRAFDAHVDGGGRALLLCSEVMHWQVRVDLAERKLYRYRELHLDPHPDPLLRTTLWHHPSLRYPIYPRTGCELWHGGSGRVEEGIGWDGMRIVRPDSPLLQGSGLDDGDVLWLPDTTEWDGAPVEPGPGVPRVDFGDSPPWRHEVIGYNLVRPAVDELPPGEPATSLWIALRRTPESGTVVHGGSMGWCGVRATGGHGPDSERARAIVLRMLALLRDDAWPFSSPA
jgi:hypothetical protein